MVPRVAIYSILHTKVKWNELTPRLARLVGPRTHTAFQGLANKLEESYP